MSRFNADQRAALRKRVARVFQPSNRYFRPILGELEQTYSDLCGDFDRAIRETDERAVAKVIVFLTDPPAPPAPES